MSLEVQDKISIAKEKKELGDQAFKAGELTDALRAYHEALLYLNGIDKSSVQGMIPSANPSTDTGKMAEIDGMLEKIYANQSACHIKGGKWKRALEAAEKALSKNENNHKASFRKGKAQAELGFTEKAEKTLDDLLKKNPADASAINAELARIRAADAERQRIQDKKFRGFLSRGKDKSKELDAPAPALSPETPASNATVAP